jgi:hypothetical protein
MLDEGIWAEVKVGGVHLQLFAEHNVLGVQASVYNVNAKSWIAPSEPVKDIQCSKAWAMARAEAYLKHAANIEQNAPAASATRIMMVIAAIKNPIDQAASRTGCVLKYRLSLMLNPCNIENCHF